MGRWGSFSRVVGHPPREGAASVQSCVRGGDKPGDAGGPRSRQGGAGGPGGGLVELRGAGFRSGKVSPPRAASQASGSGEL